MDFVNTCETADSEPKLFWLFLTLVADGKVKRMKRAAAALPIFGKSMTEAEKRYVAATESKWLDRDPKVQAWRRKQQLTVIWPP